MSEMQVVRLCSVFIIYGWMMVIRRSLQAVTEIYRQFYRKVDLWQHPRVIALHMNTANVIVNVLTKFYHLASFGPLNRMTISRFSPRNRNTFVTYGRLTQKAK